MTSQRSDTQPMSLGDRIRQLRKQHGWLQKDLSQRIHATVQAVSNWEQNRAVPDSTNRRKLAHAFGITEGELYAERPTIPEGMNSFALVLKQLGYSPDDLSTLAESDWQVIRNVLGPLIDELIKRRGKEAPEGEEKVRTASIFIIDDEVKICHTLAGMLRDQGYKVDFAFNGQAAIDKLLTHHEKPDLILLDLHMPLLNGIEFLREFRKTNTQTKVVVVTGHPQDVVDLHAQELKIEGYFEKPFELAMVLKKVEELLQ